MKDAPAKTITREGKKYIEIDKDKKIGKGAFKTFENGKIRPVVCKDTEKLKPSDFYAGWRFYRPLPS